MKLNKPTRITETLALITVCLQSACVFAVKESTNANGQRTASVAPGIVLYGDSNSSSACPYRLSINQQCYSSLSECRAAGDLRTRGGPSGFSCSSDQPQNYSSARASSSESRAPALFPDSLMVSNLVLGMPLSELQKSYPDAEINRMFPRAIQAALGSTAKSSFMNKGTLFYLPQATMVDDKLWGALAVYAFLGKTSTSTLESGELQTLQEQFRKQCEDKYGLNHSSGSTRVIPQGEVVDIVWQAPTHKTTLSLMHRKGAPTQVEFIGSLAVTSNRKTTASADSVEADLMKTNLRSVGLSIKP